jgi:hypothetical protein
MDPPQANRGSFPLVRGERKWEMGRHGTGQNSTCRKPRVRAGQNKVNGGGEQWGIERGGLGGWGDRL